MNHPNNCPTDLVNKLHAVFERGMAQSYELKTSVKKSSEPSWMTGAIRRLIKKRRAVFRKFGRNAVWKRLKAKSRRIIRDRKKVYNEQRKEKILKGNIKKFHETVKSFVNADKMNNWSPRELYPGASDNEVVEKLTNYFNNISCESVSYTHLTLPTTPYV